MSWSNSPRQVPSSAHLFENRQMSATPPERPRSMQFEALLKGSSSFTRTTAGSRVLTYILNVIQQPERARASGSEAKSSAEHKAVDPPPVIQLSIFELRNGVQTDISFSYNASFFMFASLEVAPAVSNGRIYLESNHRVPVLTGVPVSGAAYLDRPSPAIYFLFHDLSVRYEGRYRLCFNLYETTKNLEDRDDTGIKPDLLPQPEHSTVPASIDNPREVVSRRLEIRSAVFLAYSAKKYPGLAESTSLSRTIAEQGCRVRIRRDVPLRRRNLSGIEDEGYVSRPTTYPPLSNLSQPIVQDNGFLRPTPAPEMMTTMREQLAPRSPSQKKHKCPYCETEFVRHHNLKSHLLTHSQEKPYVCQICTMRFRRLHDLKRHMKLHTGERPYTCPKCDRKFARGDALARHNAFQGGCTGVTGRRTKIGSFEGDDDIENWDRGESNTGAIDGVMHTNRPYPNETKMSEEDRRLFSLPSIKAQHVSAPDIDSNSPHSRTPSRDSVNEEITQSKDVYHHHKLESYGWLSNSEVPFTLNELLGLSHSAETVKPYTSDKAYWKGSPEIWKEAIWSALFRCWGPESALSRLQHPANETEITPVNGEPLSHAMKRSSQAWWLVHCSKAWEYILPDQDRLRWIDLPLLHRIFSSWHQELIAGPRLRESGDWMFPLDTTLGQEERVVERLVYEVFLHLGRGAASSVKRALAGSSPSNAASESASAPQHKSSQTSKIIGKRRDRDEAERGDDKSDGDDPNQNDRTKRIKKTTEEYSRYVICTQFAVGQELARPSCFFGAWCSVDRLKQDHLINVHNFNTSQLKIDRGGTESEKWWRLFDKLNPGFREANPQAFIPGPFWEDRVAHNTYNKIFSEAMRRAERLQQTRTQRLASDIQELLYRQRDVERQEIRQVVLDVLHSRARDTSSSESLSTTETMELEPDIFQYAGGRISTSLLQQPDAESTSSPSLNSSHLLVAPQSNRPDHTSSSSEPSLHGHLSDVPDPQASSLWPLRQDFFGRTGTPSTRDILTPQTTDQQGLQFGADLAMTATSSSETMSGTLSATNDIDLEQPFGKVCRCRFHSAECDHGVTDGNEWCACCSGWFPWSAFAEPFLLR